MEVRELELLPARFSAGTSRVFARRHILKYRHPALAETSDFLASLASAFGPPPGEDPRSYAFWHRSSGTHFTAYVNETWAAYGGGLRFTARPDDVDAVKQAYAAEHGARAAAAAAAATTAGPDPIVADLAGGASSFGEHARELERAQLAAPRGLFDLLVHFEELLARFPPPDRRAVLVFGLDVPGPITLVAKGVEGGRYFERQVELEEAHQALRGKLEAEPERLANMLFDWWSQHARSTKPTEALCPLLLDVWRARFDAAMTAPLPATDAPYQSSARARHEDHEQAQRWMRYARLGLLLPLAQADADRLAACAIGVAKQSTEHDKLAKLRRAQSTK